MDLLLFSCLCRGTAKLAENSKNCNYADTAMKILQKIPTPSDGNKHYYTHHVDNAWFHYLVVDRLVYCVVSGVGTEPGSVFEKLPGYYLETCKVAFEKNFDDREISNFGAVLDSLLIHYLKKPQEVIENAKAMAITNQTDVQKQSQATNPPMKTSDLYSTLEAMKKHVTKAVTKAEEMKGDPDYAGALTLANQLLEYLKTKQASVRLLLQNEKEATEKSRRKDASSSKKSGGILDNTVSTRSNFKGEPTDLMETLLVEEQLKQGATRGKGKAGQGANQIANRRFRDVYTTCTEAEAKNLIKRIQDKYRKKNRAAAGAVGVAAGAAGADGADPDVVGDVRVADVVGDGRVADVVGERAVADDVGVVGGDNTDT